MWNEEIWVELLPVQNLLQKKTLSFFHGKIQYEEPSAMQPVFTKVSTLSYLLYIVHVHGYFIDMIHAFSNS